MMASAFYFILKILFILKIFKFLSGFFGHQEKASLLNGLLACSRALRAVRAWRAFMFGVLACFTCLRARMLYDHGMLTCLVCFKKLRAWRALKNGVVGVLQKMACLKLLDCFLDMCDHGAPVN